MILCFVSIARSSTTCVPSTPLINALPFNGWLNSTSFPALLVVICSLMGERPAPDLPPLAACLLPPYLF